MYINELEIINLGECKQAVLQFSTNPQKDPVYLVHSQQQCEIITLALQLMCGPKYINHSALHEIRQKISQAKIKIRFTLPKTEPEHNNDESTLQQEHSSDSDVPCTSKQALLRQKRRSARRRKSESRQNILVVNACRDFSLNPDHIVYSVDGSLTRECSVVVFQIRFFSCTDVIFPRLMDISYGEYCNGRWLDLLSMEFVNKEEDSKNLLSRFCQLHAHRKIPQNHLLNKLTTSVLTAHNYLNNSRLSHLINIFNDIRWLFEYMTCSEYTVWFLLPSTFGNLQDIRRITTENINFNLMKTQIQLKQANAEPFLWTQAEKHVQELLLVAVQLAFGYHCQQNIIYLHCLHHLVNHQSFEFLNYSLIQSSSSTQLLFEKNYFNRIFNVCAKLNICCVLEYCGGLPSYPTQASVIDCQWLDSSKEWQIKVKDYSTNFAADSQIVNNLLQQLEETLT